MTDMDKLNACQASRKKDREHIASVLIGIAEEQGAAVVRRDDGPNPGYRDRSITLRFTLNGVGATVDIDNLFGGERTLISWYNDWPRGDRRTEYYSDRFNRVVGEPPVRRAHHKATSHPADWYSLAMLLEGGLTLAARGEAFAEREAEAA